MGEAKTESKEEIDVEALMKDVLKQLGLGSKDEAIAKGISDLTDEEKMELMSNLDFDEDDELALIKLIGESFEIPFLIDYVEKKLRLRCSRGGWKSEQIVRIASEKRKEKAFGFLRGLFRRKEKTEEIEET
jgi:hypothetical protein